MKGHKEAWLPVDRATEAEENLRVRGAQKRNARHPRRVPIRVQDLLTYAEFVDLVAEKIAEYNLRTNRMLGCAPEVSYHRDLDPRELRQGRDAITMLRPRTLTVTKDGLEHRNRVFAAAKGEELLRVGQQVLCRADPLLRVMWGEISEAQWVLLPKDEYARRHPPEDVARKRAAIAKEYSEQADEAVRRKRDEMVGEDEADQADHEYKEAVGDDFRPDPAPGRALPAERPEEQHPNAVEPKVEKLARVKAESDDEPELPRGIVSDRRKHLKLVDEE